MLIYSFFNFLEIANHSLEFTLLQINLILFIFSIIFAVIYYKKKEIPHLWRDLSFIIIALFFSIGLYFARNLLTIFIIYEVLTFITIPLICKRNNFFYAKYLFFFSNLILLPLILIAFYFLDPTLCHVSNYEILKSNNNYNSYIIMFFAIFAIVKTGIIPVHAWLLSASNASYPISAILHAVVMINAGIFLYIKMFKLAFFSCSQQSTSMLIDTQNLSALGGQVTNALSNLELSNLEYFFNFNLNIVGNINKTINTNQNLITYDNILFLPGIIIFSISCLYSGIKCFFAKKIKEILIFSTIKASSFILFIGSIYNFDLSLSSVYIRLIFLHSIMKFFIFVLFAFTNAVYISNLASSLKDNKLLKLILTLVLIIYSGIAPYTYMYNIKKEILSFDIFKAYSYSIHLNIYNIFKFADAQEAISSIFSLGFYFINLLSYLYILRILFFLYKKI